MNLKLMGLRCLIKAILDTFYISKKLKKGTWKKNVQGRSISHYLQSFFSRDQISSENSKPFWSFCLGKVTEVHLPYKDGGARGIGHSMTMTLDTRKFNFENQ